MYTLDMILVIVASLESDHFDPFHKLCNICNMSEQEWAAVMSMYWNWTGSWTGQLQTQTYFPASKDYLETCCLELWTHFHTHPSVLWCCGMPLSFIVAIRCCMACTLGMSNDVNFLPCSFSFTCNSLISWVHFLSFDTISEMVLSVWCWSMLRLVSDM